MHRTQIYLAENEINYLRNLSRLKKKNLSELIREAIDKFYMIEKQQNISQALDDAFGLWADRDDLPNTDKYVRSLRKSTRLNRLLK